MYSFDVFGTIVLTMETEKKALFSFIQTMLQGDEYREIPISIRRNFAELRYNAEQMAEKICKKNGHEMVSINDIYEIIGYTAVMDERILKRLVEIEEKVIEDSAIGIEENIFLVEKILEAGKQVFFLADTIYNEKVVLKILQKCSSKFEGCRCYCSSLYGKTQRTGNLFWKINQVAKVKRSEWFYYTGSNMNLLNAKKIGLASVNKLLGTDELFDSPQKIENEDFSFKLMCHAAQAAVLKCKGEKQRVGSRIGGPVLIPYVEWILENTRKLNVKKLFFVARDGYILKIIADILIRHRKYEIETNYIYGSRKAWRMASFSENNCNIAELLRWSHVERVNTYKELAEIFELTVSELQLFLPKCKIDETTELSRSAAAYCIHHLKANQDFKEYLIRKNSSKRKMVQRYLIQEIGKNENQVVFVELAGGGYTQECLADILYEIGITSVINFYFKMDSINNGGKCKNYFFWPNNMKNSAIIETLCHSEEGQTVGYNMQNGRVTPVLLREEGAALQEFQYHDYVDGIIIFTNLYIKYLHDFCRKEETQQMISIYLNMIGTCPDKELLMFVSKMPFEVTGRESTILEYAPILTNDQIWSYYFKDRDADKTYKGMYWEYSLLRTEYEKPEEVRECRDAAEKSKAREDYQKQDEDKWRKEKYPCEFVADHAVVLCLDVFGEKIYESIKREKKYVKKVNNFEDILRIENSFEQIIIGTGDVSKMFEIKIKLEKCGIDPTRILALDINPKFLIGK